MDQHSKSMSCHPLVPESKHMLGSPNSGTFTLGSQIPPHVITWRVWNAISTVTNKSTTKSLLNFEKGTLIHSKRTSLPSFTSQVLKLKRKSKSLPNSNPKTFIAEKGNIAPLMCQLAIHYLNYKGHFCIKKSTYSYRSLYPPPSFSLCMIF